MDAERTPTALLEDSQQKILGMHESFQATCLALGNGGPPVALLPGPEGTSGDPASSSLPAADATATATATATAAMASSSAEASQMPLIRHDVEVDPALFPAGKKDVNGQQIDLRTTNSWMLKLGEISTPEIAEVGAWSCRRIAVPLGAGTRSCSL